MPLAALSVQHIINCDLCTVGNKINYFIIEQKYKNMAETNRRPSIHVERNTIQPPQSFHS